MKNYILDNLPSIWIVFVFILGLTLAVGNAKAEHKSITQYGLGWSQIPVVCGPTESVQEYLTDHDFELESLSFGHENAHPDGAIVYMVSYFINNSKTQAISVITAPSGLESCMLYRAFGLSFPGIKT